MALYDLRQSRLQSPYDREARKRAGNASALHCTRLGGPSEALISHASVAGEHEPVKPEDPLAEIGVFSLLCLTQRCARCLQTCDMIT